MSLAMQLAISLLKAILVLGALLNLMMFTIWVERKGSALMQDRIGANRAAIFGFDLAGIFNTLIADPLKALFKEDFVPQGVSQFMHSLAPFLAVFPILLSFAVVPFGPNLVIDTQVITLQLANLNVGLLFVFAMGSLAVYGVVLAGWISNNKFSLFGALRATAQMLSYEVTLGVSAVGLLCIYQSLDLQQITLAQSGTFLGFLPRWGFFLNPLAFFLFFTSLMAETKRVPFDLPESESEIIAGYLTEYSGMKFLLFWMGEFAEIVLAATLVSILFFGGWQLPYFDISTIPADLWGHLPEKFNEWNFQWAPLLGTLILGAKVTFFCVLQVIIRWTLPRFRYDQLMKLCWKIMFPLALLNLLLTALLVLVGFYR